MYLHLDVCANGYVVVKHNTEGGAAFLGEEEI